jgi:hypothetical protein
MGGNGLFGPVIAASLAGELEGLPYVNLSVSEVLLIADVSGEPVAVTTGAGEAKVPSKDGLRVPDDLMRVDVGLKGIKSIYKTALDGAESNRVAVKMPATASNFELSLVKFIFVMNFLKLTCMFLVGLDAVDTLQTGTGRHGGVEGGSWVSDWSESSES